MSSIKLATDTRNTRTGWVIFRLCSPHSQARHLHIEHDDMQHSSSNEAWGDLADWKSIYEERFYAGSKRGVYALIGERDEHDEEYVVYAALELTCPADFEALMLRIRTKERLVRRRRGYVPANFFTVSYVLDESGLLDY